MPLRLFPLVLLTTALLTACGSDAEAPALDGADGDAKHDFVLMLDGALTDTLRGPATFGTVTDPETGRSRLIVELSLGGEAGSGAYLSPGDTRTPDAGTYPIAPDSAAGERFTFVFRQGMIRALAAEEGTLTLETVTDTLLAGRFTARLVGQVVNVDRRPGELPNQGRSTVEARGRFVARPGPVGFVVGS